jgi:hypothetical protein
MPARADDAPPAAWKYDNPFCKVLAAVAPLGDGRRYAIELLAPSGITVAANVTLISASDAYQAAIPDTNLEGALDDRGVPPVVFALPAPDKIQYVFVDSYAIDRAPSVTCPSFVFPIGKPITAPAGDIATLSAPHLQSLGKLACGHAYQDVEIGRDPGGLIGHYGNKRLSVTYHVYVDSAGHAINETTAVERCPRRGRGRTRKYPAASILAGAISLHAGSRRT